MKHHTHAQIAHAQPAPPISLYGSPAMTFAIIAVLMMAAIVAGRWNRKQEK